MYVGCGVLVGIGVCDWMINGVVTGVLVGIGKRVAVVVAGSETWEVGAGDGVGSACLHANNAPAQCPCQKKSSG